MQSLSWVVIVVIAVADLRYQDGQHRNKQQYYQEVQDYLDTDVPPVHLTGFFVGHFDLVFDLVVLNMRQRVPCRYCFGSFIFGLPTTWRCCWSSRWFSWPSGSYFECEQSGHRSIRLCPTNVLSMSSSFIWEIYLSFWFLIIFNHFSIVFEWYY